MNQPDTTTDTEATRRLKARDENLREDIIKISDKVYVSVGYSVSTVSMIIGDDGIIIIDTGMAESHVKPLLEEFRKITDKPVKAIILTHSHGDHTGGVNAFRENGNPDIWARDNFGSETEALADLRLMFRAVRQGGFKLPPNKRINNGIAPAMTPMGGRVHNQTQPPPKKPGPGDGKNIFNPEDDVKPNRLLSGDREKIEISGVRLELVAAPGETDDALYVWLPEEKILFAGDNFYASFPNIYAIRGVGYRDIRKWAKAVDMLLNEGSEVLVSGHTRPVIGKEAVAQTMTDYRDAIQFVYDKTIEGINNQLTPDELVDYVKLPPHLAEKDYLGEYYGMVAWAVRAIYAGLLGPFDGNATNLYPLNPKEEATRLAKMIGGVDQLTRQASEALASGDFQWAAQLADHLLALDKKAIEPLKIKADALSALGERQLNSLARNCYFTWEMELRAKIRDIEQ